MKVIQLTDRYVLKIFDSIRQMYHDSDDMNAGLDGLGVIRDMKMLDYDGNIVKMDIHALHVPGSDAHPTEIWVAFNSKTKIREEHIFQIIGGELGNIIDPDGNIFKTLSQINEIGPNFDLNPDLVLPDAKRKILENYAGLLYRLVKVIRHRAIRLKLKII